MNFKEHDCLVSVILAAYNSESFLRKSVSSLTNQSLKEIEIIIVNDASTDDTLQIANAIAKEDCRIKVINLKQNVGVYGARAMGIKEAKSPWIGFLDADDFARPEMFKILFESVVQSGSDIVVCGSDRVSATGKILSKKVSFPGSKVIEENIFERFCKLEFGTGALWNKLYRGSLIKRWGGVEHAWRQETNEDVLINIGAFHSASKVMVLSDVLHEYTFNEQSVTSTKDNQSAFFLLIKAYFLALNQSATFPKKDLYLISELYRRQLDWSSYRIKEIDQSLMTEELSQLTIDAEAILPGAIFLLTPRRPACYSQKSVFREKLSALKKYLKL